MPFVAVPVESTIVPLALIRSSPAASESSDAAPRRKSIPILAGDDGKPVGCRRETAMTEFMALSSSGPFVTR
jgi:hypothetical protein